jgi:soluble cytochrome b562
MADVKNLNPDLQDKEPQLSKEELSKRREEITEFYKDNIPHLEVQADYESLLAAIEKARAERMQAQMFMAQQYASQEEGGSPDSEEAKAFKQAMEEAAAKIDS